MINKEKFIDVLKRLLCIALVILTISFFTFFMVEMSRNYSPAHLKFVQNEWTVVGVRGNGNNFPIIILENINDSNHRESLESCGKDQETLVVGDKIKFIENLNKSTMNMAGCDIEAHRIK